MRSIQFPFLGDTYVSRMVFNDAPKRPTASIMLPQTCTNVASLLIGIKE